MKPKSDLGSSSSISSILLVLRDSNRSRGLSSCVPSPSVESEFYNLLPDLSQMAIKTLFLTIFDLLASIVFTFSIAAYPVWICDQ